MKKENSEFGNDEIKKEEVMETIRNENQLKLFEAIKNAPKEQLKSIMKQIEEYLGKSREEILKENENNK